MFKVLIVDDEILVVSLIEKLIDWKSIDMQIVGTANDGVDALELVKALKPDIVIVDVRMPGYDGITFMKKVREINEEVHFIVISGHKKFQYAKSAMQYNVEDYLLKPISKKELEDILIKLRDKLIQKQESDYNIKLLDNQLGVSKKELRKHFARRLMDDDIEAIISNIEEINEINFTNFQDGIYQTFIIKIDSSSNDINKEFLENFIIRIQEYVDEILNGICQESLSIIDRSELWYYVCYTQSKERDFINELKKIVLFIDSVASKFEALYGTIATGTKEEVIGRILDSKQKAKEGLASRRALGVGKIIVCNQVEKDPGVIHIVLSDERKTSILEAVKSLSQEKLRIQIANIFTRADEYKYKNTLIFDEINEYVINIFYEYVNRIHVYKGTKETLYKEIEETQQFSGTGVEMARNLQKFLGIFLEKYVKENEGGENPAVRIAKRYIADNFKESISLNFMAEIVHLSPVYFSILFKKEEGINFLDYLNQYRLNIAKELLKDVQHNINEVASMTGFQDARYFSKIFKKNIGITPTDYRNRSIG